MTDERHTEINHRQFERDVAAQLDVEAGLKEVLVRSLRSPERIVRALDREDAPVSEGLYDARCLFCEADAESTKGLREPNDHAPDCTWRLAREWVAAHD